jgi:hypothetical protein
VTSKKFINELAQAHDDELSATDAVADVLQTEFTMGPSIKYDQYHVGVIGSTMTRNLIARFDDVYDEIACSCEDVIRDRTKGDCRVIKLHSSGFVTNNTFFVAVEWISVPAFDAVIQIIARTGNRLFVGLPLCKLLFFFFENWLCTFFNCHSTRRSQPGLSSTFEELGHRRIHWRFFHQFYAVDPEAVSLYGIHIQGHQSRKTSCLLIS